MSDIVSVAGPLVVAVDQWSTVNAPAIGALVGAVSLALLDGLKRTGPFTRAPWLLDAAKLLVGPLTRAVTDWLASRRKGGK